mmetsp:Transcript_34386/g.85741  ORF Transcript_34386/g.85741 Transcript_34386/m.85741 type:complete len:221 (+) Transcript_34386:417-1079(+)
MAKSSQAIARKTRLRIRMVTAHTTTRGCERGCTAPVATPLTAILCSCSSIALRYFRLRSMEVAASQDQRSASARAASPILRRSSLSTTNLRTCSVKSTTPSSPGCARTPFTPSSIRSGTPPARTPTGGTPDAMDSSTTKPSVSESDGITNTSADAKADESSAPFMIPRKRTRPDATRSANSFWKRASEGPPPTIARVVSGKFSSVCRSCCRRFESQTRPT